MKWASAVSEHSDTGPAIDAAALELKARLGGAAVDLVLVFASPHHAAGIDSVPARVAAHFPRALVVGCSAGGIIGGGREIEEQPALAMSAAVLPGVLLRRIRMEAREIAALGEDAAAWRVSVGLAEEPPPVFILLPDPYTCPPEPLLAGLDRAYPQSAKVGGLVSGGAGGRNQALLLGNSVYRRGLVGVALAGDVAMDVVVAQGCRPVGAPMVITDCKENSLLRLNEIPPGKALETLYESLAPEDQKLFRTSLFVGVEADEHQVEYRESDVLVRNIVGMDPQTGAIAIGARPQRWQVVRFLLRDAAAARQDLRAQLGRYREVAGPAAAEAAGALLFSCLGRGKNLYGRSGHDSEVFREFIGAVPLAGFFCNGEIGPVRGTTYLHGYTSAFGILRPRSRTPARRPARG